MCILHNVPHYYFTFSQDNYTSFPTFSQQVYMHFPTFSQHIQNALFYFKILYFTCFLKKLVAEFYNSLRVFQHTVYILIVSDFIIIPQLHHNRNIRFPIPCHHTIHKTDLQEANLLLQIF